ncbi:hypothetical protein MED297_00055 [Reinekea sp. MED297]|uniref:Uncharacterized protein n=1 Tax=Reinekea blandensis MED297 TaxID=314283 RepID=A4BJW5_9GAMM|nr:hypothetical protein MED297_00055 [Reinekea sp. MED297] [Reinekea blandensis MED297]
MNSGYWVKSDYQKVKVVTVHNIPKRDLKAVVQAYRASGAQVKTESEAGRDNEYCVTAISG